MQSVCEKMQVSQKTVIGNVLFRMEHKAMKAVFDKAECKDPCERCDYKGEEIKCLPGGY